MASGANPNRYAEIFEHAPIGRLITDGGGVISEANRTAADLLGVSRSDLVGASISTFVSESDERELRSRLQAASEASGSITSMMRFERRNVGSFDAELQIRSSEAEVGSLHWTMTDVTERVAIDQQLRRLAVELEERVLERTAALEAEKARLAAVVEQIPAGLTIIGSDGRVVMANAEARRLLGDDAVDGIAGLQPFGREGVGEGRAELARDDGTHVVLHVSVAPVLDAEGNPMGAVQLFQDVTAQERQERAEREFVTNAAHQLQSPLAAIVSAIEVLQSGAKDAPERETFLGHIEREANRLSRLVRALLVLARAQTGYEAPKDEVVSLEPLLTEVASSLRTGEDVAVEVVCPPDLAVVTNRELAEQALLNVAENAAKYTRAGRITLEARVVDHSAQIVVADTGPGVPTEDQPHVLDRFYRATPNGTDGFGLGFAIVRSSMDALGGELEVDSTVGVGTVVTLRLPHAASLVGE